MTVKLLKEYLHTLIDKIDDPELLAAYYKVISSGQSDDWWEKISQDEQKAIQKGIADLEEGMVYSHDSVMEEVKRLLNPSS